MNLRPPIKATLAAFIAFVFVTGGRAETTPETNPKILARIALLSDPHVNRATNGGEALYKARFEKAIAQVNAAKVDFTLIAGDLTQSGKPDECADFKTHLKQLRAPVWFVPGNHDAGNKFIPGRTNAAVTPQRIAACEKNLSPSWFVKKRAGVRIIGLNSSLLGSGFEREVEMWKFLERELAHPAAMPTILLMHYPLFLKDPEEPGGDYFNLEPAPRARLYQLLQQGGVKTVLTGHLHRPLVIRRDGILFLTTAPISFGLPPGKQPEGWTLVTLFENGETQEIFQPLE